ncbi:MAG: YCF48-related protein [Bacteroidota bacterium]|nr:YCF48-related protein [Candidatus Kapabacteria bacterium]MDW8075846.1 YCF48-related protein [Bacteroidota bacterium]MDW8271714.1 YCF48-related protein [Bacteroidota bacterium]
MKLWQLLGLVLWTTTLGAQSWQRLIEEPCYGIAINPKNPRTLYVGGEGRQLYRSYDGGKSWDTIVVEFRTATTQFTNVLVHPIDTNVVFVGGIRFGTLRRSNNNGQTWESVLVGQQNYTFSGEAVIVDPTNPQILYAAEFMTSTIFRSTDRGRSWQVRGSIPPDSSLPTPVPPRLCCIAIRPDSTGILYAGCQGSAIYRSDDSGRTWRLVQRFYQSALRDTEIPQIRFSTLRPNVGYAVMTYFFWQLRPNGGLWRTTDGGWSWHVLAFQDTSLWAMGIRPRDDRDELVVGGFTEFFDADTVVPGARIIRRTVDEGRTWQIHDDRIPWLGQLPGNVFAFRYVHEGANTRLYCATDAGLYALDVSSDEPVPPLERERFVIVQPMPGVLRVIADYQEAPAGVSAWAELYNVLGQQVARIPLRRYGQRAFYGEANVAHLPAGMYYARLVIGDPIASAAVLIPN